MKLIGYPFAGQREPRFRYGQPVWALDMFSPICRGIYELRAVDGSWRLVLDTYPDRSGGQYRWELQTPNAQGQWTAREWHWGLEYSSDFERDELRDEAMADAIKSSKVDITECWEP